MGCGDVIMSTISMFVTTKPCCGDIEHYHYVRFYTIIIIIIIYL